MLYYYIPTANVIVFGPIACLSPSPCILHSLREQCLHVVHAQLLKTRSISTNRTIKHKSLSLLQCQDTFFNGVFGDEPDGTNRSILTCEFWTKNQG